MTAITAVALSGGVDSLVAAALLKERGHRAVGLHFLTGFETTDIHDPASPASPTPKDAPEHDVAAARRKLAPLAEQLDIPLHIIDLRDEFKRMVVDYFIHTYRQGRTPNPCLVCNPSIKFEVLFARAQALGAERIATGHYARTGGGTDGHRHLWRGADRSKDQSYFLARLTQEQLGRAVFPLAEQTKQETIQMAAAKGLKPITAGESQDICFIRNAHYAEFLARQPGFEARPGPIEDVHGRVVGQHPGVHRFTIGQRRGINCPADRPYYVVHIDHPRNCLVVGYQEHLATDRCHVTEINWIIPPPEGPMALDVRIRYRHSAVPATLTPIRADGAEVRFARPEPAVTPGQGAVFYLGDEVLGGGWIQ